MTNSLRLKSAEDFKYYCQPRRRALSGPLSALDCDITIQGIGLKRLRFRLKWVLNCIVVNHSHYHTVSLCHTGRVNAGISRHGGH